MRRRKRNQRPNWAGAPDRPAERAGQGGGGSMNLALDLGLQDDPEISTEVKDVIRVMRMAGDPAPPPPPELLQSIVARVPEYLRVMDLARSHKRGRRARLPWRLVTPVRAVAIAILGGAVALVSALMAPVQIGVRLAHALEPVMLASHATPGVHMLIDVRDSGVEDFDHVDTRAGMVPMEVWIRWPEGREIEGKGEKAKDADVQTTTPPPSDRGRMRVEKQGRIYAYDGERTIHYWAGSNEVLRETGGGPKFDVLWPAAWVAGVMDLPRGSRVLEEGEVDGEGFLRVRWPGPSPAPRTRSWFQDYEREVEIRWSLETQQLTGLRRWIHTGGSRLLVTESRSIQYMPQIGDEVFAIEVPADARVRTIPPAPPEIDALGPREAAERFWKACIAEDWDTVGYFCSSPEVIDFLKKAQPRELRALGEPFRKDPYVGVFVPYEIKYKRIWRTVKHNLALRNDNRYGRWVWDGGI